MRELDYRKKEKQWAAYHKLEKEEKRRFLAGLSAKKGFRILSELFDFASGIGDNMRCKNLNMEKIKVLARVHSAFGKVTA